MPEALSMPIMGLSVDEVAKILRVDRRSVISAIKNRGLPARKIGRSYRISRNALENWLATGKIGADDECEN